MAKRKDTVRNKSKNKMQATQRYLQFAGVHDDTLILKNGGVRAILEVGAVNFNLKSEAEQEALIRRFQQFLNALDFPVQILVQSRKLDIDQYIADLRVKRKNLTNDLLQKQMAEYIEYVQRLVEYADIMEKKFYVVIPSNPMRAEKKGLVADFLSYIVPDDTVVEVLKRRSEFLELKKELDTRVNVVMTSIDGMGLSASRVQTADIIETFYQIYNPNLARRQKFDQVSDLSLAPDPADEIVELD